MAHEWELNQQNLITFVMVDAASIEVAGLGNTFTLEVSKNGAAFVASGGTKAEIGSGWYSYLSTAAEANTPGPVSIRVTGAGSLQQNLEYVVIDRNVLATERTYTVYDSLGAVLPDVRVEVYTDAAGTQLFNVYNTDTFGVARDMYGDKPRLQAGTWYFYRYKHGYSFNNPDTEVLT